MKARTGLTGRTCLTLFLAAAIAFFGVARAQELAITHFSFRLWGPEDRACMTNAIIPGMSLQISNAIWASWGTCGQIELKFFAPSNSVFEIEWKAVSLFGPYCDRYGCWGSRWVTIGSVTNSAGAGLLTFRSGMVEDIGFFRVKRRD